MSAIETLAELLTIGGGRFRLAAFPQRDVETLMALGVVLEDGIVNRAVCEECDDPHEGDVRRTDSGAELLCPLFGWRPIDVTSVSAARLDIAEFARLLQRILGSVGRLRQIGSIGVWALGVLALRGDRRCACFLAPHFRSVAEVQAVRAAIAGEPKIGPAAVFCEGLTDSARALRSEELHLLDIATFVRIEAEVDLAIDLVALEAVLASPQASPATRPGPAPKFAPMVKAVMEHLWQSGEISLGVRPETQQVLTAWTSVHGQLPSPSERRCRELIAEIMEHRTQQ